VSFGGKSNLVDAVLQELRLSACADLFGDTWDGGGGVQKFAADYAPAVEPPWLVVMEPGETYEYMSPDEGFHRPFIAEGVLQVSIFAEDRQQARELGDAVARALNDVPLDWVGAQWRYLRLASAGYQPVGSTGPGVPTLFNCVLSFSYAYQGAL